MSEMGQTQRSNQSRKPRAAAPNTRSSLSQKRSARNSPHRRHAAKPARDAQTAAPAKSRLTYCHHRFLAASKGRHRLSRNLWKARTDALAHPVQSWPPGRRRRCGLPSACLVSGAHNLPPRRGNRSRRCPARRGR